jgi:carbon storage regulator CsrA
MLVLTRKRDDVIRIGDDIVIRVIRTGKGSVKIGVDAPSDVKVMRGELMPFANHLDATHELEHHAELMLQH